MTMQQVRVRVVPGDAVVARYDDVLLLAAPAGETQEATLDELLAWCDGGLTGADLVRRVAALLVSDRRDHVPDLGLVTVHGDGVALLLHGDVVASGDAVLDAGGALTFVERVLAEVPSRLAVTLRGAGDPDRRSDLRGGMVRGAGFAFAVPAGEELTGPVVTATPAPAAPEPAPESEPFEPISITPVVEPQVQDEPVAAFTPIPLFEEDEPADEPLQATEVHAAVVSETEDDATEVVPVVAAASGDGPQVRGVVCSRGHFTDPAGSTCRTCQTPLLPGAEAVVAPRPSLGRLVHEDGTTIELTGDLLVGRDPGEPQDATPVPVDDPQLSLSRVHARILLDSWEVRIEDAGSSNGTFVAGSDGQWKRLEAGVPTTLHVGENLALGAYVLRYDA